MKLHTICFALILIYACASDDSSKIQSSIDQDAKPIATTKFDSIKNDLIAGAELMTQDLLALGMIDKALASEYTETSYCDTSVQLNDSIFYSIVSIGDHPGICTYSFLVTMNTRRQAVVQSQQLFSYCDEDELKGSYCDYVEKVVATNKIQVEEIMTILKKKWTSKDPEENIDHEEIKKSFYIVAENGQIKIEE